MDNNKKAILEHAKWRGKLSIDVKAPIENDEDLAIAYTPGVAAPCLLIEQDEREAYKYTGKGNMVAVITDGTAVLGLGDIGPAASMPVMEGKCALFKRFAGVDAIPICIDSKDVDEIVNTIRLISKSFGGINLEDISAPRCFEIENKLIERCDIPIFHDDQHGTAIITAAAIINSMKLTKREIGSAKIVINGAGAAGISIANLLYDLKLGEIIICDSKGIIYAGNPSNNKQKEEIAKITNKENIKGDLSKAVKGADIFIGVSKPDILSEEMVKSMANDPIIFAMSNPIPEIMPDKAKKAGAKIVGTGRSDFPNQVNNVLIFPGFFKGLLKVGATKVTKDMKMKAAVALAGVIKEEELREDYVLPNAFDERVVKAVADAVSEEALKSGLARIKE